MKWSQNRQQNVCNGYIFFPNIVFCMWRLPMTFTSINFWVICYSSSWKFVMESSWRTITLVAKIHQCKIICEGCIFLDCDKVQHVHCEMFIFSSLRLVVAQCVCKLTYCHMQEYAFKVGISVYIGNENINAQIWSVSQRKYVHSAIKQNKMATQSM